MFKIAVAIPAIVLSESAVAAIALLAVTHGVIAANFTIATLKLPQI